MAWRLVLLTLLSLGDVSYASKDCVLDFQKDFDSKNPLPIIIRDNKLLTPDPNSCSVRLAKGSKIHIGCPGAKNSIMYLHQNRRIDTKLKELEASCDDGSNFKSKNSLLKSFAIKEISCKEQPEVTVKKTSKCGKDNKHQSFQCGYLVANIFVSVYESCYDESLNIPSHVKHKILPHTCAPNNDAPPAPSGNILGRLVSGLLGLVTNVLDIFYNILTSLAAQKKRFFQIFGKKLTEVYLRDDQLQPYYLANSFYFATRAERWVTTHYVNLASQWKSIAASLESLQHGVQTFVNQGKSSATVFSGTIGVLTLPTNSGKSQPVFLVKFLNKNMCPVPHYFFKVVIIGKKRVAFLISNSIAAVKPGKPFCTDLGSGGHHGINWKHKRASDLCCDYEEFKNKVNYLKL